MPLKPTESLLTPESAGNILDEALKSGGDFAEIYLENSQFTHLVLTNGQIHEASPGHDCGAGIRVVHNNRSAYVYTSDLSEQGLLEAAKKAAQAIKGQNPSCAVPLNVERAKQSYTPIQRATSSVKVDEKLDLLRRFEDMALSESKRVTTCRLFYSDLEQNVLIANSQGRYITDHRNRVRTYIQVVIDGNERRRLSYGPAASSGFEFFESDQFENKIRGLVQEAIHIQNSEPAPVGEFPVIIGSGSGGTLFHEACGHCLEAEAVANHQSVFGISMFGELIASEYLTLIDDGTLPGAWGSQNIDDEGMPTQKNVLIENGILKNYLLDQVNGAKLELPSNGCARRQSYRYAPTGRMTNTYIQPGKHTFAEMISGIKLGLFAKRIDSGAIDPVTGQFALPVTIGYLIKDGKLDRPVHGAQLVGNAQTVLKKIEMIGSPEEMDWSTAICNAKSGVVQVTFGLPPVKISQMRVIRG